MKLFKYSVLSLICFARLTMAGILDQDPDSSHTVIKFPKSFYHSHSSDILVKDVSPKTDSNNVAESSSRELSNEGKSAAGLDRQTMPTLFCSQLSQGSFVSLRTHFNSSLQVPGLPQRSRVIPAPMCVPGGESIDFHCTG